MGLSRHLIRKNKMKLTKDEACDIVCDDHDDWITVETNIVDNSRWSIMLEGIFQHGPTGKFYQLSWNVGATEQQEETPFEYYDPEPVEVHQVEKMVKVWESVE